ncbi:MAG: thermonuclease family protein [Candidatus Poribacteria bacterium]|nr:thermonuclease family protein [Candidatus Poribacteria bacterium]
MKRYPAWYFLVGLILPAWIGCEPQIVLPPPTPDGFWTVTRIVDGDTVVIERDGAKETARLIGVDTPETKHPSKPVQHYGPEATVFVYNLLIGETVRVEYDRDRRDRYQRLLVYLYRADDNLFVNAELVKQGYGRAYTSYPFYFKAQFVQFERDAKAHSRGLWLKD